MFVGGKEPKLPRLGNEAADESTARTLAHVNGRVLYYAELLVIAQRRYREYRESRQGSTQIEEVPVL